MPMRAEMPRKTIGCHFSFFMAKKSAQARTIGIGRSTEKMLLTPLHTLRSTSATRTTLRSAAVTIASEAGRSP